MRRTSTIEADWPEGAEGAVRLRGRARDAFTPLEGGAPEIIAEDGLEARLSADRTILAIEAWPPRPALSALVGLRGGGGLRNAVALAASDERTDATPLFQLLDDIAPFSLIVPWAQMAWSPELRKRRERIDASRLEDVCIGFRAGSPALAAVRCPEANLGAPTTDIADPRDPGGWHPHHPIDGPSMRRARWIEVGLAEDLNIQAGFQDSARTPDGGRRAVHEYWLSATADPETLRITRLVATPSVLPYGSCSAAVESTASLIGARLPELRRQVLERLAGPRGCTHLNDAMRALAEAPALVGRLRRQENHQ